MNVNTDAVVTRQQLAEVVGALEAVLAKRTDLVELADLVEKALPDLIAKAIPPIEKCEIPPVRWHFDILRDEEGLISEMTATQEPRL